MQHKQTNMANDNIALGIQKREDKEANKSGMVDCYDYWQNEFLLVAQ